MKSKKNYFEKLDQGGQKTLPDEKGKPTHKEIINPEKKCTVQ